MNEFNFNKQDLKKLVAIIVGVILIGSCLAFAIIKTGALNKLIELAKEEIILSMCILVPILLNVFPMYFYGLSMSLIPNVVDGIVINKVMCLMPIYNSCKISGCYYESELKGILGKLPILTEILMILFYIGGLIYLYITDGFFIFTPAIITWGGILFGLFIINNIVKSICMGKIAASFNDVIPLRGVSQYYLIPLVGGCIVFVYYLIVPAMILFGLDATGLIKSTLINLITILLPFFLPIYSCFSVRRVINIAYAFFMKESN